MEIIFQKDRFLFLKPPTPVSMPKPQRLFLNLLSLLGFPAPPKPLKSPPPSFWCLQGPSPPLSPYCCNCIRLQDLFRFLSPCGPTGGEWDYGTAEQRNRSTPVPGQTPLPQSLMGQRRGAQRLEDVLPKPQSQALS